jgi:hypothetical protein
MGVVRRAQGVAVTGEAPAAGDAQRTGIRSARPPRARAEDCLREPVPRSRPRSATGCGWVDRPTLRTGVVVGSSSDTRAYADTDESGCLYLCHANLDAPRAEEARCLDSDLRKRSWRDDRARHRLRPARYARAAGRGPHAGHRDRADGSTKLASATLRPVNGRPGWGSGGGGPRLDR